MKRKAIIFKHERRTAYIMGLVGNAIGIDGVASWMNFSDAPLHRKKAIHMQAMKDHARRKRA